MLEKESYQDEKLFTRRGTFKVSEEMLRSHPYELQLAMAEVIITDCVFNWNNKIFEYWAVSPHFKPIKDNQLAPEYRLMVDRITKSEDLDPDYLEYKISFQRR